MIWSWVVGSKLGSAVAALSVSLMMLFMAYFAGRRNAKNEVKFNNLEDYVKTKKVIDNVESSPTRDAAIERLRRNNQLR